MIPILSNNKTLEHDKLIIPISEVGQFWWQMKTALVIVTDCDRYLARDALSSQMEEKKLNLSEAKKALGSSSIASTA